MKQLSESVVQTVVRPRPQESHKGTFGRVLIVGGNAQFGGAAIMAASAAVYAGAGLVTVATDPVNRSALHARLPEAMIVPFNDRQALKAALAAATVIVIGPGLGTDEAALAILQTTLGGITPAQTLILDGSAITLVAEHQLPVEFQNVVWTPHQMEWQRLSGLAVKEQTVAANTKAAAAIAGTVIVKAHRTQIFSPTASYENTTGSAAMATGGSGDTLTGILAAFIAQFGYVDQTVCAAVYAHSAIADGLAATNYVVLPSMVIAALPHYMQRIAASGAQA
ncbi:NAD(P)H-hydrate dehydratase [Lacticaseibacillus yichunensis]|uniref:ADP-dependent (S)-NAD(P)H-hydrate dehydratase n=1 Tax=Lacticaseibacillus yichunensis TaxID=2486015 RepID=A0ABW4CNR1_9LACO|nr:NAD(P)H-hydrate dehydratase [Lacticaseibacillus yichunensis]